MRFVPGPDLPTGGRIVGLDGIRDAYETGRGTFRIRATASVENVTARRKGIVVTELPFTVGPEKVIAKIKDLVGSKKLQGIADLKDLTDRAHGLRLVIEVKNGFDPEAVLEQLYKLTPMEETFGINNVALVDGQPLTLGLQGAAGGLRRPPLRGGAPAQRVPPHASARTGCTWSTACSSRCSTSTRSSAIIRSSDNSAQAKERLMERFSLSRDPGAVHPGHAAAPAHQVRPDRAGGRAGPADAARSPS